VQVVRPRHDAGSDPVGPQDPGGLGDDMIDVGAPLRPYGHPGTQGGMRVGLKGREHAVFEVPLQGLDAQSLAQRDQHVLRGRGDAGPTGRRADFDGEHVVQPVGELHHEYPHVDAGRDDHLADGLHFGGIAVEDLLELGHPVDQESHLATELGPQLSHRVAGVLDRVVQQRRDHRRGVHPELGDLLRDREGMGDERLAALAQLAPVHQLGHLVRPAEGPHVAIAVHPSVASDQKLDRVVVHLGTDEGESHSVCEVLDVP
jgi:hypothetical protein